MAWKFTGFMEGRDKIGSRMPAIYGPLPIKVWVRVAGEKIARVRNKVTNGSKSAVFDSNDQDRKAVEYCRWLALRDGKAIGADTYPKVIRANVAVNGRLQNRVMAVSFTNGKRGDGCYMIDIPNWDWTPRESVEMIDDTLSLAA